LTETVSEILRAMAAFLGGGRACEASPSSQARNDAQESLPAGGGTPPNENVVLRC
jgi:hypothetical protein